MAEKKLLDQVRDKIRLKQYSFQTEKAYCKWIYRFIKFHNLKHPAQMGPAEIEHYLTHLAVHSNVVASTQNQALNAIVFLYKHVLKMEPGNFNLSFRAKTTTYIPVVLNKNELKSLFSHLYGVHRKIASLMYGSGLGRNKQTRYQPRPSPLLRNPHVGERCTHPKNPGTPWP